MYFTYVYICMYLPIPLQKEDVTQDQCLSGV